MTLVNYAYHAGVTDSKDFLAKLNTFAIAQGWSADYRTSVAWDAGGGWVAGTSDFLQLSSTCYGNCDKAVYRFYAYNTDADNDVLYNTAHTTATYSTSTSTPPREQDAWGGMADTDWTSMPSSAHNIAHLWIFGNQKYLYPVAQYDDYWIPAWHLGTIDLYPEYQARTDCGMWGCPMWDGGAPLSGTMHWGERNEEFWYCGNLPSWYIYELHDYSLYDVFKNCYFGGQGQSWYTNGAAYSYFHHGGRFWIGWDEDQTEERGHYNWCKNVARTYGPNGRRIAFKPDYFVQDVEGEGDIMPLGKVPFYIIPFNGLDVGETINENGYEYLCFPFRFTYMNIGFAFRIA